MKKMHVLNAVKKLVRTYNNDKVSHCPRSCPLCVLFFKDNCLNCPNYVFDVSGVSLSCTHRGYLFPKLDFTDEDNNKTLSNFWQEVYNNIFPLKESIILEMGEELQQQIYKIAEKHNKLNTK